MYLETNLTISWKWPRWIQCHHLNKFGSTWVPDAVYQVSRSSAPWFRRRKCLKSFTIYGPGSRLGYVTRNIWTNFHPNIPWMLHMKSGFKQLSVCLEIGQWMTLSMGCHKSSSTHLFNYPVYIPTFTSKASIVSCKFFQFKNKRDQIGRQLIYGHGGHVT